VARGCSAEEPDRRSDQEGVPQRPFLALPHRRLLVMRLVVLRLRAGDLPDHSGARDLHQRRVVRVCEPGPGI